MAPSTGPWPPNSDNPEGKGYRSRKRRKYGTEFTNVRTGQMLSIRSLRGDTEVTDQLVEIRYGIGEPPIFAANRAALTKQDVETTDIEKVYWAAQGGRSFYELDDEICQATFNRVSETLRQHLVNPGR